MKRLENTFILIGLACIMALQGCLGLVQKPQPVKEELVTIRLSADSGYLFKGQVLPFLAGNNLADTLATWWKQWKTTDTIGKYYRNDSGHIMCILTTDEALGSGVEVNKLIEVNKKGELTGSEEFTSQYCNINRRTEALQRRGNYFITWNCGQGSAFSSASFRLFKNIKGRVAANDILESYYEGAPHCKNVSSAWLIKDDTCYINYAAELSAPTDSGCTVQGRQKVPARYYNTPHGWQTADSAKLRLLKIEPFAAK